MEKTKREPFLKNFVIAVFVSFFIFVIILFVTYQVSYFNYSGIKNQNSLINQSISQMDSLLTNKSFCDDSILLNSSIILDENGKRISILETRLGFDDPIVLEQKKIYFSLEFKHYQIINLFNKNCKKDFSPFLFFYSNKKVKFYNEDMGPILSTFKSEHPEQVMVYSFDYDLDTPLIESLKEDYSIQKAPIVISPNGEKIYLENIDQLEPFLINNSQMQQY